MSFSASLGYALYLWSYSHFFRILMESLGRLPRRFLAAAAAAAAAAEADPWWRRRAETPPAASSPEEWSSVDELG